MKRVEIYTTPTCGYCLAAKMLLRDKGAAYEETDVSRDPSQRQKMAERAGGRRSVPQVFIDGVYVGGFEQLYALENQGRLDQLLAA